MKHVGYKFYIIEVSAIKKFPGKQRQEKKRKKKLKLNGKKRCRDLIYYEKSFVLIICELSYLPFSFFFCSLF